MNDVIDVCCGSRMFYFDKTNSLIDFCDIRDESHVLCDGRKLNINPDFQCDFRDLPFDDESKNLVIFDPPHLVNLGQTSWMAKKYGVLNKSWKDDIRQGFIECFRVLRTGGTLVFKWNEDQIPTKDIIKLSPVKPLMGNRSGKQQKTHWILFYKEQEK